MAKRNLLLVNLGSPNKPTPESVGEYLKQFLMDPFVIDIPRVWRWILVHLLIVPKRKYRSAEAYSKVWGEEGSPLLVNTKKFAESLQKKYPDWDIRWAMRYGSPDFEKALEDWLKESNDPIDVVPLYPQYAKSSTGTCWNIIFKLAQKYKANNRVRVLQDFYDHPEFIKSFSIQLKAELEARRPEHVLFSFHGLPEHHIQELDLSGEHCLKKADCCSAVSSVNRRCYRAQCFATARAMASLSGLTQDQYSVSFQSRLGNKPWVKPYTDQVLNEMAFGSTKRTLVVCPSFVSDCLETLEEIQIQAKADFNEISGGDLYLVPSLNDSIDWIESFGKMMEDKSLSWEYADQWKQISITRNSSS